MGGEDSALTSRGCRVKCGSNRADVFVKGLSQERLGLALLQGRGLRGSRRWLLLAPGLARFDTPLNALLRGSP